MKAYGRLKHHTGCCPGHDVFPSDSYNNRRSKKARSRDKKVLHRWARHVAKNDLKTSL